MIPSSTSVWKREGSLSDDTFKMGVNFDGSQLYELLTDIYSDPETAMLREYPCNALDSHREAGNTDPILVRLPTPLSPFLEIQDFGVGMSQDDMRNTFSTYGVSTKRGSNDFVGTFGIGSKSALTYTNAFTVVGIKDGVQTIAQVFRDEEGIPNMSIVDVCDTAQPNGVTISIPVNSDHQLVEKAANLFRFWTPGTVLVNGEEPEYIGGMQVTSDTRVIVSENTYGTPSFVTMGNVAYPFNPNNYVDYAYRGLQFIVDVKIGSIKIAPDRESLIFTDDTTSLLKDKLNAAVVGLTTKIQEYINAATDYSSAVELYVKWMRFGKNLTYRGESFPTRISVPGIDFSWNRTRYAVTSAASFNPYSTNVFVHGFGGSSISALNKRKIRQYMQENYPDYAHVYLTNAPVDNKWVAGMPHIHWSTIAAIRFTPVSSGNHNYSGPTAGTFEFWTKDGHQFSKPLPKGEYVYFSPSQVEPKNWSRVLTTLNSDAIIVKLAKNRHVAFQQKNRTAKSLSTWMDSMLEAAKKDVTAPASTKVPYPNGEFLTLDPDKIDDPELSSYIKKVNSEDKSRYESMLTTYRVFDMGLPSVPAAQIVHTNWIDLYPLINTTYENETYFYINAKYAAKKEEN